jgi:hypothetical protein
MKESYLTLNIGEEDHEATLNYIRSRNSENTDFCDLIDLKEYNVYIPLTIYGPSRKLFELNFGLHEEENKISHEADIIQDECLHDIININQNKIILISKSYVKQKEINSYEGFEFIKP